MLRMNAARPAWTEWPALPAEERKVRSDSIDHVSLVSMAGIGSLTGAQKHEAAAADALVQAYAQSLH